MSWGPDWYCVASTGFVRAGSPHVLSLSVGSGSDGTGRGKREEAVCIISLSKGVLGML